MYVYRGAKAHGSEKVSAPEREIKDMGKDEYDKYIKQTEIQKALTLIKTGYSRIKEKIKTLQQEYRKTVINTSMIIRITEKRPLKMKEK